MISGAGEASLSSARRIHPASRPEVPILSGSTCGTGRMAAARESLISCGGDAGHSAFGTVIGPAWRAGSPRPVERSVALAHFRPPIQADSVRRQASEIALMLAGELLRIYLHVAELLAAECRGWAAGG